MTKQKKIDVELVQFAIKGDLDMVKCLVEQGADIHADNDGALRVSASEGHLKVVKYLIIDYNMMVKEETLEYLREYNLSETIKIINTKDLQQQLDNKLNNTIINNIIKLKLKI